MSEKWRNGSGTLRTIPIGPSLNKEPGEGGLSPFGTLSRRSENGGAGNWVRIEGMRGGGCLRGFRRLEEEERERGQCAYIFTL